MDLNGNPMVIFKALILDGSEFKTGISKFSSPNTTAVLFKVLLSCFKVFKREPMYFAWPIFLGMP